MAERKLRTKKEVAASKAAKTGKTKLRSSEELIDVSNPEAVAKKLKETEVLKLIEDGARWDKGQKELAKKVKTVKKMLLVHAIKSKWKTKVAGNGASAAVSPSTSTFISPSKFLKMLIKLKKKKMFETLFSVRIGDAKKYLGEDVLEDIADVETEPYGSVTLKSVNL